MKQIPNIYRIDKGHHLIADKEDNVSIIEKIINTQFSRLQFKRTFDISHLKTISIDSTQYYLYVYNSKEVVSDWKDFLPTDLTSKENFLQQKLSLIIFIESRDDLFAVVGGAAYQIILPFLDQSYGLNTYSRIMDPQQDELASIKSRGITGTRAGINEQFRNNYRLIDFIKFGKVPQEINVKLSKQITDVHFGFILTKKAERTQVSVGKGFKIKKEISFNELHKLIEELGIISELAPSDYLSSYKEITDRQYIEEYLKPELMMRIWDDSALLGRSRMDDPKRFHFDFCNPNSIEKFYEADEYKLKEKTENNGYAVFEVLYNRHDIYNSVLRRTAERSGNDFFQFRAYVQGIRIVCYQQGKITAASSFLFHISTELSIQGKPTFLIDTKWYHLRNSFVNDLKTSTYHVLRTYKAEKAILPLTWNKNIIRTEKEYNLQYDGIAKYIVLDTIIVDGIELSDILHYDDDNLYLIHVKYGFSSQMRELTNQVSISARRLKEALGTKEKVIIEKVYEKVVAKGHDIGGLSLSEFKELFDKRITYVLAFTSHLIEDTKVETNIERFDSNIARFSLVQCSSDMRANYFDLLTHQIDRN